MYINPNIYSIAVSGTNIYAGGNGKVFISTNYGTIWITDSIVLTNQNILALANSGTNLFAGTGGTGVLLSTNNGLNWSAKNNGLTNLNVHSLAFMGTNLFAGTIGGGVFVSTNNGTNWTAVNNGLSNLIVYSLAASGTNLFAGTEGGVFLSKNNGINWVIKNQGFTLIPTINSLSISNGYIFSGTLAHSVWLRSYSEITGIQKISELVPSSYFLSQNYPNPFNPITNIRYELLKSGLVNLVVFDVLGREIELLVNEKQNAGTYEITFNASQYSSGIYFYRLTTDNFSDTKKMLMIK
jgi:hypothetical protein